MPYLTYISDADLTRAVDLLLTKADAARKQASQKFNKNVIDPFSPLFELAGFAKSHQEWRNSELTRQAQKTVNNSIGLFHQSVLGSVPSWTDLGTGGQVDLINSNLKIIAKVKNKYSTVKGADQKGVYYELDDLISRKVSNYKDYTAYFVTIIPRKPEVFNKPFTPSDKERGEPCKENQKIRIIDGVSFYELVTRKSDALHALYEVLPDVIEVRSKALDIEFNTFTTEDKKELNRYFDLAYKSK